MNNNKIRTSGMIAIDIREQYKKLSGLIFEKGRYDDCISKLNLLCEEFDTLNTKNHQTREAVKNHQTREADKIKLEEQTRYEYDLAPWFIPLIYGLLVLGIILL